MDIQNIIKSLRDFQMWILDLKKVGMVTTTDDIIIHVDEAITRRFCLGVHDNKFFFGMQEPELCWFKGFPWSHLAAKKSAKKIYFVCDEQAVSQAKMPAFALSFQPDSPQKIELIASRPFIDIRKIEIDLNGEVTGVSKEVIVRIPIATDFEEGTLAGLMEAKNKIKPKKKLSK